MRREKKKETIVHVNKIKVAGYLGSVGHNNIKNWFREQYRLPNFGEKVRIFLNLTSGRMSIFTLRLSNRKKFGFTLLMTDCKHAGDTQWYCW